MQLSARLEAVLAFLAPAPRLLDVGTDHGWLPIEAVRRGIVNRAIAADRRPAPLEVAATNVREAGLQALVSCKLSDGLRQLEAEPEDALSICGMGGRSVVGILLAAGPKLDPLGQLILQPNYHAAEVREWAYSHGWHLAAETLIQEQEQFYAVLAYRHGQGPDPAYRPSEFTLSEQFLLGPCLLAHEGATAQAYYRAQAQRLTALGRLAEARVWSRAVRDD